MLNNWIENNIKEIQKICDRVSKGNNSADLCQVCIEQLLNSKSIINVPDNQKLYFFTRIVKNNYNSSTSRYDKIYRKTKFVELALNYDTKQEEYEEPTLSMSWVLEELELLKKTNWYLSQIFLLWLSRDCNLSQLSKEIGIPINSLSRDVRQVKVILNELYKQKLK